MLLKKYIIYLHKNNINKKFYIGQTCQDVKNRWRNGQGYKKQTEFYKDIELYGWDNFKHEILLENIPQNEVDEKETFFIELFKATNPKYGYNILKRNYSKVHFSDLWENEKYREKIIKKLTEQRNTKEYHDSQSELIKNKWKDNNYRKAQKDSWTEERKIKLA